MSCFVMRCHEAPCAPGLRRPLLPRLPRARRMSFVRFRHASRAPSLSGIEKAAPLCPEGAETPRRCHEMSCDVMFRRTAPVSARLAEAPSVPILHIVPPSRFVPFTPPPACGGSALFRAYRTCARARVCAGAVRAPDCAHTSQAQGARLPSVPVGLFSRRREAGHGAARGCRFLLSHPTTVLQGSSPYRELFHNS